MNNELTASQEMGRRFLQTISDFIWHKHTESQMIDEEPPFKKIREELLAYKITDIDFDSDEGILYIKLARPGVFIGVKGENVNAITEFIKKRMAKTNFGRIKLIEDRKPIEDDLLSSLYSYQLMTEMNEDWW